MRLTEISAELYHNTDLYGLYGIINSGHIGKRVVSLTRDKSYYHAPGGSWDGGWVRFVFDRDELKQRHKIVPVADQTVASGSNTDDTLKGHRARWEAEERVVGKIPLTTAKRIEIDQETYEKIQSDLNRAEDGIEFLIKRIEMLEKGYFWGHTTQKFRKIETEKQKKAHATSADELRNAIADKRRRQETYLTALEIVTVKGDKK